MRDATSNCLAVAAMPGLEELAEIVAEYRPKKRRNHTDPLAQLLLGIASRAHGSQEQAGSALRFTNLWAEMRASAASVGRELPEVPATPDQIDRLLASEPESLTVPLERGLNRVSMRLARSMGLFDPAEPLSWDPPLRDHHITGDGAVMSPQSGVTRLSDSSAQDPARARVAEVNYGKPDPERRKDDNKGVPFVVVSTHTGRHLQRLVFGLQTYMDGNEIGAAMDVFGRLIPAAAGGIHTVHYDRLLNQVHALQLTRMGVVPIAEFKAAQRNQRDYIAVAADDPAFMRGKRRDRPSKERLRVFEFGAFSHGCTHQRLWSVDGELRVSRFGMRDNRLDSEPAVLLDLERRSRPDRHEMVATYQVPCPECGGAKLSIDLAQDPGKTSSDLRGLEQVAADRVRAINERDPTFWEVAGRRSDSESTVFTIKHMMPLHGRASRLTPGGFLWDLVCAGLLINAQAWDVTVGHTALGRHQRQAQRRRDEARAA